ncbi:DUF1009 domain-containing protein [Rhodobacteraceae bacterium WD3A24]|nr:DUF1009 domain-containing protein [Rhodobacteraceae bacterium WD3A24]
MTGHGAPVAIIGGTGRLPGLLAAEMSAAGQPFVLAELDGAPIEAEGERLQFRLERLVPLFDRLHDLGVERVVLAGAVRRPRLEPEAFDPRTAALVPQILDAMQGGDDGTLRAIIALFEEAGFEVTGADGIAPVLLPEAGVLGRVAPSEADGADAARAAEIVTALGAVDVGQGAVVAQGLCLAVEALPGTDRMLAALAAEGDLRPDPAGARGVLYKAPKPGQDRRVDLPALGPQTVRAAARAGLAGVAFEAGGVLLIEREAALRAADDHGLFLWAR